MARAGRVRAAVLVHVLCAGLVNFLAPASLCPVARDSHPPRRFAGLGIGTLCCQRLPRPVGLSRVSCKNAPFDYKGVLSQWAAQEHVKYNHTTRTSLFFQCSVEVLEGGEWLDAVGEPARTKKQAEEKAAKSLCEEKGWATNADSFKMVLHERVMRNLQDAYATKLTMGRLHQSTLELFNDPKKGKAALTKVEAEQNVAKKWCEELRLARPAMHLNANQPGSQSNS